ncbi:hypothetical protein EXIGLDRAFT_752584 [Exidia glandulosa HHB12029]|uniref:Uncharacterized protein n=1 Tax=Exidia glandulosa HHB12029 TaxID=1314781 RepID=A0A165EGF7_EXIGL|nr:hypothetical protein EXIGLDRAFT_752584 [Exidia glandulosa HHB12029]
MALDTIHYLVPRFLGNDGGLFAFVSYIPPMSFDAAIELLGHTAPNNDGLMFADSRSGLELRLQWLDAQTQTLSLSVWAPRAQQPAARVTFVPLGTQYCLGVALRYALLHALQLQTGRAHVALSMRVVQQEQIMYTTRSNGPAGEVVEQQVRATRAVADWVITPLGAINDGNAA